MRGDEAEAVRGAPWRRRSDFRANIFRFNMLRLAALPGALALCLALGACQTDGTGMAGSGGRTLAFESIDGPPQPTFDKLVGELNTEAQTRRVAVVSRSTSAAYRVKGYLAMHVERGKASVAYAWDVYDANQTRVARVAGEEPAGPLKGGIANGWASCDDAVLARIADRSMASLAETLGVGGTAQAAAASAAPAAAAPEAAQPAEAPHPEPASGTPVAALSAPAAALAYAHN